MSSVIGLIGLAVMGQNFALNIASKGFPISVYNRSFDKTEATVSRAASEGLSDKLTGYKDLKDFVQSIAKPRPIVILIQAGAPVDQTIEKLLEVLEEGDIIIDGGNEWYTNTERRSELVTSKGLQYMGMGISGGEEGARNGPSLMPGGPLAAYQRIEDILLAVSAKADGEPCVTHIGPGGAGNYVKMVHNGIEYGDMQLIAEAYDILKNVGGLTNDQLAQAFDEYNQGELESFLIEITAQIFKKKDEDETSYVVDKIVDRTGSKGTGKWTVQEAADLGIPAPTIAASLDARYMSSILPERQVASSILQGPSPSAESEQTQLIQDVKHALYAAKICSYAQGMNIIRERSKLKQWNLDLGKIAKIWKGGCIIRARFLDRIKSAYDRDANLANLLVDPDFSAEMNLRQQPLRKIVSLAFANGIAVPSLSASLAYYDSYRRSRLPANLTQAQRDFFGAHTYQRFDKEGAFHTEWTK